MKLPSESRPVALRPALSSGLPLSIAKDAGQGAYGICAQSGSILPDEERRRYLRLMYCMPIRQPGYLDIAARPVGFASLPCGRFALVGGGRKPSVRVMPRFTTQSDCAKCGILPTPLPPRGLRRCLPFRSNEKAVLAREWGATRERRRRISLRRRLEGELSWKLIPSL